MARSAFALLLVSAAAVAVPARRGAETKRLRPSEDTKKLTARPSHEERRNTFRRGLIETDVARATARIASDAILPAERTGELGSSNVDLLQFFRQADAGRLRSGDLTLNDAAIRDLMQRRVMHDFSPRMLMAQALEARPALLRLYARAAELQIHANLHGLYVSGAEAQLSMVDWPQTRETAALLKRVARGYHLDDRLIEFAGESLGDYNPDFASLAEEAKPVGKRTSAAGAVLFDQQRGGRRAELDLADEAIRPFFKGITRATFEQFRFTAKEPREVLAELRFLARAAEIGRPVRLDATDINWVTQRPNMPVTPEAAEVLRRLQRAYALNEDAIDFGKDSLTGYRAGWWDRNIRRRSGGWWEKAAPLREMSDDAVKIELKLRDLNEQDFGIRLDARSFRNLKPADRVSLLRVYARGGELGLPMAVAEAWLNKVPWPETSEAASVLRRVARAYRLDEQKINFAGKTLAAWAVTS